MKTCIDCNHKLPLEDFHFNSKEKTTRKGFCKKCASIRYKKRREANPEYYKGLWKKASKKYQDGKPRPNRTLKALGLPQETFVVLTEQQENKCFICKEEAKLVVDHCHIGNKLRKLLCSRCNLTIGAVKEDVSILKSMINYLETFN